MRRVPAHVLCGAIAFGDARPAQPRLAMKWRIDGEVQMPSAAHTSSSLHPLEGITLLMICNMHTSEAPSMCDESQNCWTKNFHNCTAEIFQGKPGVGFSRLFRDGIIRPVLLYRSARDKAALVNIRFIRLIWRTSAKRRAWREFANRLAARSVALLAPHEGCDVSGAGLLRAEGLAQSLAANWSGVH